MSVCPSHNYCPHCGRCLIAWRTTEPNYTPVIPLQSPPMKPIGPYYGPVMSNSEQNLAT